MLERTKKPKEQARPFSLRLPSSLMTWVHGKAADNGNSRNQEITNIVSDAFNADKNKEVSGG